MLRHPRRDQPSRYRRREPIGSREPRLSGESIILPQFLSSALGLFFLTLAFFFAAAWALLYLIPLILIRRRWKAESVPAEIEAAPPTGPPDSAVVLIHGTFARNAAWATADSKLGQTVARHGQVHRLTWSGKNSMADRRAAIQKLRRHVRRLRDSGKQRIFLVAHSHGGNIALKAAEVDDIAESVRAIVCLSTPFIHRQRHPAPRPRGGMSIRRAVMLGSSIYLGASCMMAMLALLGLAGADSITEPWPLALPPLALVLGIAASVWLARIRDDSTRDWDEQDLEESVCIAERIQPLTDRTLILSHPGDEADGVLKLTSLLNQLLVRSANRILDSFEKRRFTPGLVTRSLRELVLTQTRILAFSVNSLFGAANLASATRYLLTSSETPLGRWRHQVLRSEWSPHGGLYHSTLYEDDAALQDIDDWLRIHAPRVPTGVVPLVDAPASSDVSRDSERETS